MSASQIMPFSMQPCSFIVYKEKEPASLPKDKGLQNVENEYPLCEALLPKLMVEANKKICKETIQQVGALYGIGAKALEELKAKKFDCFDSLATDCACFSRALFFLIIGQKLTSDTNYSSLLSKKITVLLNKQKQIDDFIKNWQDNKPPQLMQELNKKGKQHELSEILTHLDFSINCPWEFSYAIQSYLLTITKKYTLLSAKDASRVKCAEISCEHLLEEKDEVYREVTKIKKLEKQLIPLMQGQKFNNAFHRKVCDHVKTQLTQNSNKFIIEQLGMFDQKGAEKLKSTEIKISKTEKKELADYYNLTSFLKIALHKNLPVIFKIQKCLHAHQHQEKNNPPDLAFYLKPKNGKFSIKKLPKENHWDQPVIVVGGKRSGDNVQNETTEDYLKRLMTNFDFYNICEMDAAQHKQYTSQEQDEMPSKVIKGITIEEGKYIDALKIKASKQGSSLECQTKIVLTHIFTDNLQHLVKKLPKDIFPNTFSKLSQMDLI